MRETTLVSKIGKHIRYTFTDTHAEGSLKWCSCIIPPPHPLSSHHQSLLNLKSSLLGCSFCMNLFSVAQFGWSATLTIPQVLRVRAQAQGFQEAWKRRRGRVDGRLWDGPDRPVGRHEPLSFPNNNKDPHCSTLRPCNPRGHGSAPSSLGWDKRTQMLPPRIWRESQGGR